MSRRFPLCRREELRQQGAVTRWLDELRDEVTAFELNGELVAWSSVCPHFGGELAVEPGGAALRCRWHGWRFDAATGACLSYETTCRLRRYQIVERDGMLEVVYDR